MAIGEIYSDELTVFVPFANSLTKNTNKIVRSVNADMVIHVFLSLEIFIVYKNPRATVIKPKTGIGGKAYLDYEKINYKNNFVQTNKDLLASMKSDLPLLFRQWILSILGFGIEIWLACNS